MTKLNKYHRACNELAQEFMEKYFCDKDTKLNDLDWYWVSDKPGTVLCIGDYFFNMDWIVTTMKIKPAGKKLFKAYDYFMDCAIDDKKPKMNWENYLKYEKLDRQ